MINQKNQPSQFSTKNLVEVNEDVLQTYSTETHIEFQNTIISSISCSSSDAYILLKGNITTTRVGADVEARE